MQRKNLAKNSKQQPMAPPDVTFIFGEDVVEWDAYLTRQFEGSGTVIQHEQVEKMTFPLACLKAPVFSDARVVLVILSPALVHFLDNHASESFQFTKLLKPSKTIAMLCGVSSSSIADVKNVLVSYDDWRHLEAKDKDINMVRNVIELIQEMLAKSKENERINKPKFKLVPRKVQEGNGKVYVILARPLDDSTKIRITLESNGAREVPVKKRNPYTLVFVIPDDFMQTQTMVNVHVWLGENLLGVSPVKCVSKMVELYSLLISVVSPYEFLCNTLGVATLHDVDTQLAKIFKKNLSKSGFELLEHDVKHDRVKTNEEFPTLLHFAARHGLYELVKELLACPGSRTASNMKNGRGLTPAQLANHAGHNDVAAVIDEFLKPMHSGENLNFEVPVIHNQNSPGTEEKVSNPLDCYDIPAHPVPVLHLPSTRIVGNTVTERESEYMKMKGSHKENVMPHQNLFWENSAQKEHEDMHVPVCNAERAKLSLLESQAKLIEIMEAYKKGASLIEVEKLHNEWKTFYQVSDAEAKSTLDGLRNLYAKAQKAKLSKKHSSSFSELRQFLNSKLRRKESIGSKGSLSRKQSKDMNSMEKLCAESDAIRPMSTLSVLSNTSSSSGSSFDRLSTASAGSDSGHHSDFCDERTNKLREKFESRYHQQYRTMNGSNNNITGFQKNMQSLTLSSRPPAPPPRPTKTVSRYGSLEDCKLSETPQYAVAKKSSITTFEDALNFFDFIQPDSKNSSLSNEFRSTTMKPKSLTEILSFEDPNANYDCPPPPRPNIKPVVKDSAKNVKSNFILNDPKTDYDLVPPPLPVSAPPRKQDVTLCDRDHSYDIPNPSTMLQSFHRSNSASSNYDFPKTTLMDNTDIQPACTCQVSANKSSFSSVKSCCIGNKLSSLKQMNSLPSVPNTDIITSIEKEKQLKNLNENRVQIKNLNENRSVHNQYYNVCLRPPRDIGNEQRDSIPEEMAPPPPIIENETPEDHYKMVGTPVPVPSAR